jgi:tetratricopeptide (TPR) repeat protein
MVSRKFSILRSAAHCVFAFVCMLALGGCATSTLKVSSLPEGADVSIIAPDRAPVKIGKTPLEIESRNYPELFQDSVQVQVAKDGHSPLTVLVPRLPNGGTGRINLNLQQSELPKVCQNQSDSINLLAKGIADSASLVQRKKMDEAVRLLEDLSSKFGTVPVVHDLLGNVYYLQRNMDRALDSYRRSNKLNPNNIDTIRMIERIEQLQGRGSAGV